MEIYLVRHGQSEANLSRTVQGTIDSPLTELGRRQARILRTVLPPDFDHIYTSTLQRAHETGILALDQEMDPNSITRYSALEEICFGDLQGRPYTDTGYDPEIIRQHVRFEKDILCGKHKAETIEEFFERTHAIFDKIVQDMKENNWMRVVVFTHGGVLRSILQYHLKLTSDRFDNCEVAYLKYDNNTQWELDRWTDHIVFE